jgi:hypothetical protein
MAKFNLHSEISSSIFSRKLNFPFSVDSNKNNFSSIFLRTGNWFLMENVLFSVFQEMAKKVCLKSNNIKKLYSIQNEKKLKKYFKSY